MTSTTTANITDVVKRKYGEIAEQVADGQDASCCGPSACGCGTDPITGDLYEAGQVRDLPPDAVTASLGCGNPTALASFDRARRCSTSGRAAASTSCCRRGVSVRPAWPTVST